MSRTAREIDSILSALNPVRPQGLPLDERARADLAAALASPLAPEQARRRMPATWWARPSWRMSLAALVVLGLLASAGALVLHRRTDAAYAATPDPLVYEQQTGGQDAAALLRQIATRTATLPDTTGTGRYACVETLGWYLDTAVTRREGKSVVVATHRRAWTAADQSGRIVTDGRDASDETFGPGGLAATPRLSSDEDSVARQLQASHPASAGAGIQFDAVHSVYLQLPMPPRTRAAILRYLSTLAGIRVAGTVTDRAGRRGLGFSADSTYSGLPTRYTLIIDPDTGQLLDYEEMLTTSAGKLHVRIPSVTSYTVFLSARYTDTIS
jgi:hypothetical protein